MSGTSRRNLPTINNLAGRRDESPGKNLHSAEREASERAIRGGISVIYTRFDYQTVLHAGVRVRGNREHKYETIKQPETRR